MDIERLLYNLFYVILTCQMCSFYVFVNIIRTSGFFKFFFPIFFLYPSAEIRPVDTRHGKIFCLQFNFYNEVAEIQFRCQPKTWLDWLPQICLNGYSFRHSHDMDCQIGTGLEEIVMGLQRELQPCRPWKPDRLFGRSSKRETNANLKINPSSEDPPPRSPIYI